MRKHRIGLIAMVLLAALASQVPAQVVTSRVLPSARGYLGFTFQRTPDSDERALSLTVVDVVKDSPAAKAGLQAGDVILRLNGLSANPELLASMAPAITPGDTVVFRVRRDGRERDVRVIAAKPPAGYFAVTRTVPGWTPDSVQRRLTIIVDSMRASLDTTRFRFFRRDTTGARVFVFTDSLMQGDSVFVRRFERTWPRAEFRFDSLVARLPYDSILRGLPFDSAFRGNVRVFPGDGEHVFEFSGPDENRMMLFGLGARAIAGARLETLNPELGRYFDRERGVLVIDVPQNTPARRAGLLPGDVVISANGKSISRVAELQRAFAGADGSVKLEIIRQRERRTLELKK